MRRSSLGLVAVALVVVAGVSYWIGATHPAGAPASLAPASPQAAAPLPPPAAQTPVAQTPVAATPASAAPALPQGRAIEVHPHSPEQAHAFGFQRLIVRTETQSPEACFRFDEALATGSTTHYGDYLRFDPPLKTALRVDDQDLCAGGLAFGTGYKVTLLAGLPAKSGARLDRDTGVDVTLADREPQVAIGGDGFILSKETSNGLAIQTVNVPRVRIHVLRMGEAALEAKLGGSGNFDLTTNSLEAYYVREAMKKDASLVWTGTLTTQPDHNRTVQTAFPLADIVKADRPGVYLVLAENAETARPEKFFKKLDGDGDDDSESSDDLWSDLPAHWVVSTDIALTTLSGDDGLHVFARSLSTAAPLPNIRLSLRSVGLEVLAEAQTDASGQVLFAPGLLRGKNANAPATVAALAPAPKGEGVDFTLLDLRRPAFDLSDRGVTGRDEGGPVDAFLYTERGIYRPGEEVNATALLRDHVGAAIGNMPVTLILRRPDGIESQRVTVPAEASGGFHRSFTLSAAAALGTWAVEARVDPSGQAVGRVEFSVQDFVPQQLKVTLSTAQKFLVPGQPVEAVLDGRFLYGAPAAGLGGDAWVTLQRDDDPVPDAKGYRFGIEDEKLQSEPQQIDVQPADEQGRLVIKGDLKPPSQQTSLPLKAEIAASLFEPGGRSDRDALTLPVHNLPLLIGIHPHFADDRVDEQKSADFDLRAFDPDGRPVAKTGLRWSVIRENREYDWFQEGRSWRFHYHTVDETVAQDGVDVPADRPAVVSRRLDWGHYRLVVTDPETGVASSAGFDVGWGDSAQSTDTPDKVEVTTDAPQLAPGQTAHVRIKGAFAGKAQVVIAGDRVFETRDIDVPKDGTGIEVKADAAWGPGVYVLVSMYRPLDTGRPHDPVRGIGLAWLGLDPSPHILDVGIDAPEKIVPRRTVSIPVHVAARKGGSLDGKPVYLTLAAVDEGILQLTRYKTPDPADYLFGKRRLGFDLRDDYGRLLDGSADQGAVREGGDEGVGGAGLPVVSTHIVSLFYGPVALDARGDGSIDVAVPDFEGELRLMAVAFDQDAVGSAEKPMTVRDPVIADVALPRFLAPGDAAKIALSLHNTDGVPGAYHLALSAAGPAKLSADHPLDYTLAAGERKQDTALLTGIEDGVATIGADLTGPGGYAVHRDWQIAIRSGHRPVSLETVAAQEPGASYTVDPRALDAFVPGSLSVSVGYSAYAGIDVPSLLQSLYRYPYGCTEQLASTAFPLLYFGDPALSDARLKDDKEVRKRVQDAVDKILDREDGEGRFGLWRVGDGEASVWLNVYALDFLTHAREAGFKVPDEALQRSQGWMRETLLKDGVDHDGWYAKSPQVTRAYGWYVLARAGRADLGALRRMHDGIVADAGGDGWVAAQVAWTKGDDDLVRAQPLGLAQLAGALSLMGDRARAQHALVLAVSALDATGTAPHWWYDDFYYSDVRDIAGLIAIAAEIGDTATADKLVARFDRLSPKASDLNTQEKAFLLAAAHALNKNQGAPTLSVNGQPLGQPAFPVGLSPDAAALARGYSIANTGNRRLWRTVVVTGAPRTAPPALQQGFTLERTYFSLDGTALDPSHLTQNDRVVVVLSGTARSDDDIRAVLVDMLPAGWEIEAPLTARNTYDFVGPLSSARVQEARDDRYVAAIDLGSGLAPDRNDDVDDGKPHLDLNEFRVGYVARAITPGRFLRPEAVIEDMYRPQVMARTAAGTVEIAPR